MEDHRAPRPLAAAAAAVAVSAEDGADGRLLRRVDGDVQFSEGRRVRGASVGDEGVHGGRRRRHVQRAEGEEVAEGARPAVDL